MNCELRIMNSVFAFMVPRGGLWADTGLRVGRLWEERGKCDPRCSSLDFLSRAGIGYSVLPMLYTLGRTARGCVCVCDGEWLEARTLFALSTGIYPCGGGERDRVGVGFGGEFCTFMW